MAKLHFSTEGWELICVVFLSFYEKTAEGGWIHGKVVNSLAFSMNDTEKWAKNAFKMWSFLEVLMKFLSEGLNLEVRLEKYEFFICVIAAVGQRSCHLLTQEAQTVSLSSFTVTLKRQCKLLYVSTWKLHMLNYIFDYSDRHLWESESVNSS